MDALWAGILFAAISEAERQRKRVQRRIRIAALLGLLVLAGAIGGTVAAWVGR